MKTALKCKHDDFLVMPLKHVLTVMGLVNHPGTPKLWAIVHENGHKCINDEFFSHSSLKCIDCHIPCRCTPKQCAIAHENGPKTQKGEFLVVPLKNVLSVIVLVNHLGMPKLWAIAHENGPKTQK
jgi:hypothetical protein